MGRVRGCLDRSLATGLVGVMMLAWPVISQGSPRGLMSEDVFRIADVADPHLSPDGRWVAYLVNHNDRESDESISALWQVAWNGDAPKPLTPPSLKDVSSPQWSPDSRTVSFLATSEGDDHSQVMAVDRRGGEARALTHTAATIISYQWSPNGQQLVLVIQGREDSASAKVPPPIVVTTTPFKADKLGYLTASTTTHLALFNITTGQLSDLTSGIGFNDSHPTWSPDGQRIAFLRTHGFGADPDGQQEIDIVDAKSGAMARALTRVYVPNQPRLAWTPKGQSLIASVGSKPAFTAYISDQLAVISAIDGSTRALASTLDRGVLSYTVAHDGLFVDALIEDDTAIYPLSIRLSDGIPLTVPHGPEVIIAQSIEAGHVVRLLSTDRAAPELFAVEHGILRPLTHHNDALLAEIQLGTVENLSFKSKDGTEIHGLLIKPSDYRVGQRYPTILWIHGGPVGEDEHSLLFDQYPLQFERQLLAAQGYVVLAINYRGSSGRGHLFQEAIAGDWGHKEVEDLLSGMDTVVSLGIADPSRLGVGGWSYGGILTDYLISSDTRFKAAVSGAGSGNQLSMYGADQYIFQYNAELGAPWQNEALWRQLSHPFFHADRISTPTLFLGGLKDFNVPIAGGEQMYQALKTLGVPTELVIYPDQYHILTRPSYIKDRADRVIEWYAQYLQPMAAH